MRWLSITILAVSVACARSGFEFRDLDSPAIDADLLDEQLPLTWVFARSSRATYVDSAGRVRMAAIDEPRFDHDPVTHAPRGLLMEPATSNRARSSEALDTPNPDGWFTNGQGRIEADVAIAPDGSRTADRFVDEDPTGLVRRGQSTAVPDDGITYAFSIFVRADTLQRFSFSGEFLNGSQQVQPAMTVDLDTSTFVITLGDVEGAGVIPFGGGWHRVWMSVRNNNTGNDLAILSVWGEREDSPKMGALFAWGAQIEEGMVPTSYLPTDATPQSRAADAVSSHALGWLQPASGTFVTELEAGAPNGPEAIACLADEMSGSVCLSRSDSPPVSRLTIVGGGGTAVHLAGAPWPAGETHRVVWSHDLTSVSLSDTGGEPQTRRNISYPARLSSLRIGADGQGGRPLLGHLRRFSYYPVHLSGEGVRNLSAPP